MQSKLKSSRAVFVRHLPEQSSFYIRCLRELFCKILFLQNFSMDCSQEEQGSLLWALRRRSCIRCCSISSSLRTMRRRCSSSFRAGFRRMSVSGSALAFLSAYRFRCRISERSARRTCRRSRTERPGGNEEEEIKIDSDETHGKKGNFVEKLTSQGCLQTHRVQPSGKVSRRSPSPRQSRVEQLSGGQPLAGLGLRGSMSVVSSPRWSLTPLQNDIHFCEQKNRVSGFHYTRTSDPRNLDTFVTAAMSTSEDTKLFLFPSQPRYGKRRHLPDRAS